MEENSTKKYELAARAVACKHWRWPALTQPRWGGKLDRLKPDMAGLRTLVLEGERGAGKTFMGAELTLGAVGNPARCGGEILLVGDAEHVRENMIKGPSGLIARSVANNMGVPALYGQGFELRWPSGVRARAGTPDRIRGLETGFVWADEFAPSRGELQTLLAGCRMGSEPQLLFTGPPGKWMHGPAGPRPILPDPDDPAFDAYLLALVRGAWGPDHQIEIALLGDGTVVIDVKRTADEQTVWSDWGSASLADALVAALEAAP